MRERTGGCHSDGSIVVGDSTLVGFIVGIIAFVVGVMVGVSI